MVLILVADYKSENQQYVNAFVHTRVKAYLENGIDAKVFVVNSRKRKNIYTYDGVEVTVGDKIDCINYINEHSITAVCAHFITPDMISVLSSINRKLNIYIFVHGNEALMWYERIFPYLFTDFISVLKFIKYIFINIISVSIIRSFLKESKHDITLIAVSEWMKRKAIKNLKCDNRKWYVIPNIIDDKLFIFNEKRPEQRYNLLLLRSFNSGKYANDISINVIKKLAEYKHFDKFNILIMGDGRLFKRLTKDLYKYSNIKIRKGFVQQNKIAAIHKEYGIFLCPTRQDAQGVSMCEAMSSGLIPVTSDNTAIPEFLPESDEFAFKTVDEMAEKIIAVAENEDIFLKQSRMVSDFIHEKCSFDKTVKKEILLFKSQE